MVKIEDTKELMYALRKKYDDNGFSHAFLEQVANATGAKCNRHADAIAIQLWVSRGLAITGFEVKVSRQDWLKELKNPDKAEPIAQYCHSWYLVVGDADIVQFGELPMNWGLMVPHTKESLKVVKSAVINPNPKSVDLPFLCAVLRQAQTQVTDRAKLKVERDKGFEDGRKQEEMMQKGDLEYHKKETDRLVKLIKDFETASGVSLTARWFEDGKKIGEAVKVVLNGSYLKELESLKGLRNHAKNCVQSIEEEIQKLESK
jgi:hypothetical protein